MDRRLTGLDRVFYRWRDPARCSPERLAELEAHDRHVEELNREAARWAKAISEKRRQYAASEASRQAPGCRGKAGPSGQGQQAS
jgi:hypothetical protein